MLFIDFRQMLQNVKHYILNIAILNNDFTLYIYKREKRKSK